MRIPGLRIRLAFALGAIVCSTAWLLRPLDRSMLIPVHPPNFRWDTSEKGRYINLQGREVHLVSSEVSLEDEVHFTTHMNWRRIPPQIDFKIRPQQSIIEKVNPPPLLLGGLNSPIRGYADAEGRLKYPLAWEKIPPEIELVPVRQESRWGYMNRSGQWVVEPEYNSVTHIFGDGIGYILLRGKDRTLIRGAVNRSGKVVVPCQYDSISTGVHHGMTFLIAYTQQRSDFHWINLIQSRIDSIFRTSLSSSTEQSIFDSDGNLLWRSTWIFTSWAAVWILGASGWITIELLVGLWHKRLRIDRELA